MTDPAASPSNLGIAILGLLARRPRTGYQIARLMRRPVGYFWTARHSQIYPELARLEAAALVSHEVVDGAGPRPTKRYSSTALGLAALRTWVVADLPDPPVRDLETMRLWSVWTVDPDAARALVERCRDEHRDRLAAYRTELAEARALPGTDDPSTPAFASRITLEGGVRTRAAAVEWCEWMLAELDRLAPR